MEKGKVIGVYNYGNVHRYIIKKENDQHGLFCNLFDKMGFNDEQVGEVDISFDGLEDEYIYVGESPKDFEAQLFITANRINLIIKTSKTQKEIMRLFKDYFELP